MSRKTRKLIWSAPLVAVLVVVGALAIFATQLPGTALAHDPPGVVTDIKATTEGSNTIKLSWKALSGDDAATSYRIDYSMDGHVWKALNDVTGTTYTHMGIMPGETRYYRVFAINRAGIGPMSEITSGVTDGGGRPGSVTGLKATRMGFNAIKLEWQAPAKTGGYAIKEYHIHVADTVAAIPAREADDDGDDMDADAVINTMKTDTTYTQMGLAAGDTRAYRVYAVNKNPAATNSKSEEAPIVRTESTAKQTKPSEPTGVLAVADDTDVKLYWYWPRNVGGAAGGGVLFKVEAASAVDSDLDATTWDVLTTNGAAYTQEAGNTVDYLHMSPSNGAWKYRVSTLGDATDALTSKVSLVSTSVTVPNTASTDNSVLEDPVNLVVTEERGKIILTWDKVDHPEGTENHLRPTRYRIDVSEDGIMWHRVPASAQPTQLTKTAYSYDKSHDGLEADAARFYRVFPQLGFSTGPAQDLPEMSAEAATTFPSNVRNVEAAGISATEIRVTWEPPEEDGNANIAYYLIDYRAPSGTFPTDHMEATTNNRKVVAGNVRSYNHEVTTGGTTVYFRVFAKNTMADGCMVGADERCSLITTADEVPGTSLKADVPTAPMGLTAETAGTTNLPDITDRGVLLLWNAPDDPAGGDVNGYTVQRKVVGTDADFETLEGGGMVSAFDTYFTDTELPAADEMRQYRVRAYNNDEKPGPWSNTVYYPAAMHSHNTAPMAGDDIAYQTVTAGQSVMVQSTITDADMGDTLMWSVMSSMEMYATAEVDNMGMVTIMGVAAGMATITVTATDMAGAMVTQEIMVTVEAVDTTPMAPTSVMATVDESDPGSTSVTVTWTDGANVPAHGVVLFANNFTEWNYIGKGTGGSLTFTEVASGSYIAVVVALDAQGGLMIDAQGNYLYAGATVVSVQ